MALWGTAEFALSFFCSANGGRALLDTAVKNGFLVRLIEKFISRENEKTAWEYWLMKETGLSWSDFRLKVIPQELSIDEGEVSDIERFLMEGGMPI